MRLSIGVLAHNEASGIGAMLFSLSRQTVFTSSVRERVGISSIEIFCVSNGSVDDTAGVAAKALDWASADRAVSAQVHEIQTAGKSRAWNAYVHHLSAKEADFLTLIDADIRFANDDVLEKLIRRLAEDALPTVVTDVPLKMIASDPAEQTLRDRVSLAASNQALDDHAICGQLYCARASELRKIWMPLSLPVEDGFLNAMIQTSGFTREPEREKVVRVKDASHYYESHRDLRGFLKHEARILAGSMINSWLFTLLWQQGKAGHVGRFIAKQNEDDPNWMRTYLQRVKEDRGWWLVSPHFMFKRLRVLRKVPARMAIKRAPIAILSTMLTVVASTRANRILRKDNPAGHW